MSDMNDLKLQGRIVRDAVIKTKNEKQIAYFTLAVNQTRKNADGSFFDEANYFPCSVFVSSDKFAAYLKKGQPLILEGYLKQVTKELGTGDDGKKMILMEFLRLHCLLTLQWHLLQFFREALCNSFYNL